MNLLEKAPDIMTVMEAAKILKVGRSTMYRLIEDGSIRHVRIGRKILIPREYLRLFLETEGRG